MVQINIFEGARRIAKALAALWAAGCLAYAIFAEPYAHLMLAVNGPEVAPVKTEKCGLDDASSYVAGTTQNGKSIGITLCFTAHTADDGRMLVPFTIRTRWTDDSNQKNAPRSLFADLTRNDAPTVESGPRERNWMMNEKYSSDVMAYTKAVSDRFVLSGELAREGDQQIWSARIEQWKNAVLTLVGGLVVGWLMAAAIGWIVRGFMGIPRGKDRRQGTQ